VVDYDNNPRDNLDSNTYNSRWRDHLNCSYKSPPLNQLKQTVGSLSFQNNLTSLKNEVRKIQLKFFSRHNLNKNEEFKRQFFKLAIDDLFASVQNRHK
jgi:hypothetical protein